MSTFAQTGSGPAATTVAVEEVKTCLFPVGGGKFSNDLLREFLAHSPKENPQVLIIPHAAREGGEQASADRYVKRFTEVGVKNIHVLDLGDPQKALELIRRSDVIWMPGGQQYRLRVALESADAGLPEAILNQYLTGAAIVGGTSAGAAIMSDVMIRSSKTDKETGVKHPVISYGLKLWPEVIIDQHFSERERIDRLTIAMEQHPNHYGIGIDEGTGVFYVNQDRFKVVGAGTVTVLRPVDNAADSKTHETLVLESGEVFGL